MSEPAASDEGLTRGLLYCFLTVVVAVSLVGFFTGTEGDYEFEQPLTQEHVVVPPGEVPEARSYRQMGSSPPDPENGWEQSVALTREQVYEELDEDRLEETLRNRRQRRAFDGAPPTIPHEVRQNSAAECMACHGEGLRLGRKRAQTIPHDNFTSCGQCHVPESPPMPGRAGRDPRAVANSFKGVTSPKAGARASAVAPPEIPHTSFMRENCMSCHGPLGAHAMRTSHPKRQSCTQCHAASAAVDLRPGVAP